MILDDDHKDYAGESYLVKEGLRPITMRVARCGAPDTTEITLLVGETEVAKRWVSVNTTEADAFASLIEKMLLDRQVLDV